VPEQRTFPGILLDLAITCASRVDGELIDFWLITGTSDRRYSCSPTPPIHTASMEEAGMAQETPGADHYERGLLLKKVQIFDSALEEFQQATRNPQQAGKAFAQVALCLKRLKRHDEAATAFRQALETGAFSAIERVHILYLLGETLEVLNRDFEALVVYRRIRREAPNFQDVDARIQELSSNQLYSTAPPPMPAEQEGDVAKLWGQLKPQLASLVNQTWQRLAAYRETLEPPCRGTRPSALFHKLRRGDSPQAVNRSGPGVNVRKEKRCHGRVAVQLLSQFSSKSQIVAGEGELRDLSPCGCRISSPVGVPLGTTLECWIYPQGGNPFTVEEATVQWSRRREFGLAFTKLRPSVQRQIADMCKKLAPL
jgi:PilZ domain